MRVIQHSIFDEPMVRVTDPDTSHQAAAKARGRAETHRQYALRVLRQHPEGLTDFELGEICHLQPTSVGKRRLELQRAGLVESTGRRRPTPSGALALVWRAV